MNTRWPMPRTGPASASRQSVSRPSRSAIGHRLVGGVDRREVDLAIRSLGHRHRGAPPQQIARPLRRVELQRQHAFGRDPEILAGGGQHLEAAGQQIVRVAQVVECGVAMLARRARAASPRRRRPASPPRPDRRRATRPARRVAAAASRSGRTGTPAPVRRGTTAAVPCRRGSAGGTPPPRARSMGSIVEAASSTTSARSRLPVKASSSPSSTRALRSVGALRNAACAAATASSSLPARNSVAAVWSVPLIGILQAPRGSSTAEIGDELE